MTVNIKGLNIELEDVGIDIYNKGRADGIEYVTSGRYAREEYKCPICVDCPKNCPVELKEQK